MMPTSSNDDIQTIYPMPFNSRQSSVRSESDAIELELKKIQLTRERMALQDELSQRARREAAMGLPPCVRPFPPEQKSGGKFWRFFVLLLIAGSVAGAFSIPLWRQTMSKILSKGVQGHVYRNDNKFSDDPAQGGVATGIQTNPSPPKTVQAGASAPDDRVRMVQRFLNNETSP